MKIFGREIRWSEEPADLKTRSLQQVDIGLSFDAAMSAALGEPPIAIPAVYRSVSLLADTVASLHMEQMDETTQIIDPVTPRILLRPNPFESYFETMHKVMVSLLYRGNAYLRVMSYDRFGHPASLHVLHPDEVTVTWDRNRMFPVYSWRDQTLERDKQIIHIPMFLEPGEPKGLSPIEACRKMLDGVMEEQDFHASLFTDNLTPTGIITVKGKTQEEVDIAQAKIDQAAMEGRKRTPRIISDAEWHQITITPADAEFLLARQFSVQDIARMFGLPSYFLSVPQGDPLTYATAESMGRILVTFTLRPTYFQRIEESMSAVLPEGKVARFNANELLRADIKARYDSYVAGLGAKFLTRNEVRREEGLPPIEGGDEIEDAPAAQTSPRAGADNVT